MHRQQPSGFVGEMLTRPMRHVSWLTMSEGEQARQDELDRERAESEGMIMSPLELQENILDASFGRPLSCG